MKAQKAAAVSLLAGFIAYCFSGTASLRAAASEEHPVTALVVSTTAADPDGHFTATVSLDELPDTGLCALEFAIAYDNAALNISDVTLLYDTGAQKAETLANPELADSVFTYKDEDGLLKVRWATALLENDYWLRTEQAFFTVSGTVSDDMPKGTKTELKLVPAAGDAAKTGIAAGYVDEDGVPYPCDTTVRNGAVWKPIDETGATMYGDIDLDGKITSADAVLLHRVIAEELALSAAAYANADCEYDGLLTMGDVTLILRYLNRMIEDNALGAR